VIDFARLQRDFPENQTLSQIMSSLDAFNPDDGPMIAEKLVDAEVPFLSVGVEDGTQFFRRNGVESAKLSLESHGFSESVSSAFFAEFSQPLQSERDMPAMDPGDWDKAFTSVQASELGGETQKKSRQDLHGLGV